MGTTVSIERDNPAVKPLVRLVRWSPAAVDKALQRLGELARSSPSAPRDLTKRQWWDLWTDYSIVTAGEFLSLDIEAYDLFPAAGHGEGADGVLVMFVSLRHEASTPLHRVSRTPP